jgi:hypothetical protein
LRYLWTAWLDGQGVLDTGTGRSRQATEWVKGLPGQADSAIMPTFSDSPAVVELRMLHRCLMCQKRCLIPCKFTAIEFQKILQDRLASQALDDSEDGW